MSDDDLLFLANSVLKSSALPTERLVNILNELKSYRLFYQRCFNENILVLQATAFPLKKADYYKNPVEFVLRSKVTGIETNRSSAIGMLLASGGILKASMTNLPADNGVFIQFFAIVGCVNTEENG